MPEQGSMIGDAVHNAREYVRTHPDEARYTD